MPGLRPIIPPVFALATDEQSGSQKQQAGSKRKG